jgi:hypothetical protein
METIIKQRDGKQRRIGLFDTESKVWLVDRNKKQHYMRTLKGWGLDNKIYEKLKNDFNLERVVLTETISNKVYECYVKIIDKNKIFKTFHPHRLQIFIPKIYWKMIDDGKYK